MAVSMSDASEAPLTQGPCDNIAIDAQMLKWPCSEWIGERTHGKAVALRFQPTARVLARYA